MRRDVKPVVAAGATAVISCGLLAVALRTGRLGPDAGRGAGFCEAARDALILQPANTLSNLGFVVAGLLIGWRAGRPRAGHADRGLMTVLACLVVLLGPASAAMHATQSVIGGRIDLLSMYLVASFAVAYAAVRWRRGRTGLMVVVFVAGIAFCELVAAWGGGLPLVTHAGNAAFGTLLIAAVVLEVMIARRGETQAGRGYAFASVGTMLTAFAIWNVSKTWLCEPHSLIQGHAVWHILCAAAAYFLYLYYDSERSMVQ
jgi:hypothetical protein